MNPSTADLRRIRWNLVLFLAFALLGAGAVYVSLHTAKDAQQTHREVLAKQNEIQTKMAHARDEEKELRQKFSRYENILALGYIGNEHRLDWIEQIRKIRTARKLLDLQYELEPQQLFDSSGLNPSSSATAAGATSTGSPGLRPPIAPGTLTGANNIIGYDFMVSHMSLHMQLLHEEDLLNFLGDLHDSIRAYLRINKCDVQRQSFPGSAAQLKADCSIDWITLREKNPG